MCSYWVRIILRGLHITLELCKVDVIRYFEFQFICNVGKIKLSTVSWVANGKARNWTQVCCAVRSRALFTAYYTAWFVLFLSLLWQGHIGALFLLPHICLNFLLMLPKCQGFSLDLVACLTEGQSLRQWVLLGKETLLGTAAEEKRRWVSNLPPWSTAVVELHRGEGI